MLGFAAMMSADELRRVGTAVVNRGVVALLLIQFSIPHFAGRRTPNQWFHHRDSQPPCE
jgi:hypothetical protein